MRSSNVLERSWLALLRRIVSLWVRPDVLPAEPLANSADGQPLCYVLETNSLLDFLTVQIACLRLGLPTPYRHTNLGDWANNNTASTGDNNSDRVGAVVAIRRERGLFFQRAHPQLQRLQEIIQAGEQSGITFLPVGIYWGRSPDKEHSFIKVLFSERWDIAGRSRKFLTSLIHGRNTLVQFSDPLDLADLRAESPESNQNIELFTRKLSRILRVHFRQRRIASLGPDQSHKRTIINTVLSNESVRQAIEADSVRQKETASKRRWWQRPPPTSQQKAEDYALEIAADMSFSTVRVLQLMLQTLWNRLYDGVRFNGLERLRAISDGKEVVYVPCHRSHIDYLLLSYALYMQGFSLPHIAAGLNLNMPVVGPILRRGGAFFLRRSFSGNRLYAAVFNAYVQEIIARGHSMEYFIEGGRSRSGRLLPPKGGMLAMTIQAYLKDTNRPVVFVPVYFGYERMVEGQSFISELGGAKKEKESLFGLLSSFKALRQKFGEVYANVGEPLELNDLLDQQEPAWREDADQLSSNDKPDWLPAAVDVLGLEIMQRINRAASVTPVASLATALLGAPKQNMSREDLLQQLDLLVCIQQQVPYSNELNVSEHSAEQIIEHGESLGYIDSEQHPLGDIFQIKPGQAVAMTYFRNNTLHLYAIPATIAACFVHRESLQRNEILRLVQLGYPFLKTELFLRWRQDELKQVVDDTLTLLVAKNLLEQQGDRFFHNPADSDGIVQLMLLAQNSVPALQRYYIATVLLSRQGSGTLRQKELEKLCELCAERLTIMHGLRSPDFFERNLFRSFITTLKELKLLRTGDDGLLYFEPDLADVEVQAGLFLDDQIRHSIRSITALPEFPGQAEATTTE